MCELRLAGIVRESIVDGPGLRMTVFAQGCPHHCPGCHNPQTWPFEGGFTATPETVASELAKNPLLTGLTLSGGEPFGQSTGFARLAELAHAQGKNVIVYTGYLFEELLQPAEGVENAMALLRQTDILIDGPFVQELKSYDLRFRGSSNQRSIDVQRSLHKGETILAEI